MPKPSLIHLQKRSKKQLNALNSPTINPHSNPPSNPTSNPSSSSSSNPSTSNPNPSSPSSLSPSSSASSTSSPSATSPSNPTSDPSSSPSSPSSSSSSTSPSSSSSTYSSSSTDARKKTIAGPLAKAAAEQDEDENQTFEQRVIWLVIAVISLLALVILVAPLVLQHIRAQKYQPQGHLHNQNHQSHNQRNLNQNLNQNQKNPPPLPGNLGGEVVPGYSIENTVIDPHDAPKFARLATWVTENGGNVEGTEIRSWPGTYERGVFALRDFRPGEMITIPKAICLSTVQAVKQPVIGQYIKIMKDSLPFDDNLNDKLALAVFITYEKLIMKEKSFWFPYIDTLAPSSTNFTHFLWATDEQLEKHQMKDFLGAIVNHHRRVVEKLHQTVKIMEIFRGIDHVVLERETLWSYYMIFSRAWGRGPYMELTPYGDIINHRLEGELSTGSTETDNSFIVLPAENKALRKGMELFDSYHHSPTAIMYAQTWGFIPGPSEIFMVYEKILPKDLSPSQTRLLATLSCLKGPSFFTTKFTCGPDDFFEHRELLSCLWALQLTEKQAQKTLKRVLEERLLHPRNSSLLQDPVDATFALSSLLHLCRDALDKSPGFPTDEILQNDPTLDPIERLMLRTRFMHRQCFSNVIENVEASMVRFLKAHPELVKIAEQKANSF